MAGSGFGNYFVTPGILEIKVLLQNPGINPGIY
jgi:hypothetical protein